MNGEQFVKRLLAVASRLDLTASDLAIWFARPRPTMRTWLALARGNETNAHAPTTEGRIFTECVRRLALLEGSADFPVPYEVLKHGRRGYIETAYLNADNGRISRKRTPKRGSILSGRTRPGTQT